MRDWLVGLAIAGLAVAPALPASAAIPICTADGRKDQAPGQPAKPCHALCERRREG